MILLEVGNLDGLFALMLGVMFGPPVLLFIIGAFTFGRDKKKGKQFFIAALLYLIAGGGICASLIM